MNPTACRVINTAVAAVIRPMRCPIFLEFSSEAIGALEQIRLLISRQVEGENRSRLVLEEARGVCTASKWCSLTVNMPRQK